MNNPNIVIVDYKVGNTFSVCNAIAYLGYKKLKISSDRDVIKSADALILPGVGAFEVCKKNLSALGLVEVLQEEVLIKKKPILGICVGMQLLATQSEENGTHAGLNWIPGVVKRLDIPQTLAIPHVGWNSIHSPIDGFLFPKASEEPNFYFDHSYYFHCEEQYVAAYCQYGKKITAAVQKENIFGVQFHPEKSQTSGLKLFRNFFNHI